MQFSKVRNSILLHRCLNPAWHFLLSTQFPCLKIKSVEKILGYIQEQFYRFLRGCKPPENLWNCLRKYPKMLKTNLFLGNKKLSLNHNVSCATMQRNILLHGGMITPNILVWFELNFLLPKNEISFEDNLTDFREAKPLLISSSDNTFSLLTTRNVRLDSGHYATKY